MTSNDRHSSFNSPYRTGQHVPLNPENGQMSGLATVATASESRHDVSSPYSDYSTNPLDRVMSPTSRNGGASPRIPQNNQAPYSPGARSESAKRQSQMGDGGFEMQSPTGEIPMQSFRDGQPPAPPVSNSWRRIDKWAEEHYPELFDQLCEGCTNNDLNELEHILDCSLPNDVRESLQQHDGQERGGNPTGIIFGCMLLDCEEIVQERDNWRKVNSEYLSAAAAAAAAAARAPPPLKTVDSFGDGIASASGSARSSVDNGEGSSRAPSVTSNGGNSSWRQELLARQQSVPAGAIQKAYAHPAWIPLVRDWGGNNLAIDLAPGPRGQWGQVIMFGRDYDTKYVVARSWSAFLALVADDLSSGKWFIDEDTNELKLREFKSTRVEPPYFDILRWRMDQKYNRRVNKRKSVVPGAAGSPTGSPYASPTEPNASARGRPLQRLSINSPLASPSRPGYGNNQPSPLARVTEETSLPELNMVLPTNEEAETLVEVTTPKAAPPPSKLSTVSTVTEATETETNGKAVESENDENVPAPKSSKSAGKAKQATVETEAEDAMKTIEI
ncbi:Cell wall assembly regulator [Sporothrix eucalyptigena]|uniref:Cell wall assembly regulator n=1 Tax=Sporothrix eucalyptigena TaxID=1812306 RepID=A0ABP0CBI9_9PEZI